jgi:thymidylate kinase
VETITKPERSIENFDVHPPIPLIRRLADALNLSGIAYCHWKSNAWIDRSARAENDLDLLVCREHGALFEEALFRLGFKQAQDPTDRRMPGVLNYYGYDSTADSLVHVHAHFQLILGHDATKNYHLPLEKAYLNSVFLADLFYLPSVEFEFLIFVIRMTLKHATWYAYLLCEDHLSNSEQHELEYLQNNSSRDGVLSLLAQHLPFLDEDDFETCCKALQPDCSRSARLRAGRKLQKKLSACNRFSQTLDASLKLSRRVIRGVRRRVFRSSSKKRWNHGGLLIGVIGGDGSGKTTAIEALYNWLSPDFDLVKTHLGKPRWSITTILARGCLKIGRTIGFYPFTNVGDQYSTDPKDLIFPGYPWMLREVCTAHDRLIAYRKARRYSSNGGIVITDRYPLQHIKLMDGPQINRMTCNTSKNNLMRIGQKIEEKYYRLILPPDLLIVLRLNPESAVQRKTSEAPVSVKARNLEIWNYDWDTASVYVIDAERPLEVVLADLKALIWSHL